MTQEKIRVIARGSRLSRLQVEEVFAQLPHIDYEIKYLESFGDKRQDISLLGGEAPADIFTRELDQALLRGEADIAVHSAKDLPYPLPEGIEVIALLPPFDTTDSLVSRHHLPLEQLPAGSVIGTSSPLRKKGLESLRPDLVVKGIRGCIEERVQQVKDGKYDAAIVATCALKRLGMEDEIAEVLPFSTHPLQGYLAITAAKLPYRDVGTRRLLGYLPDNQQQTDKQETQASPANLGGDVSPRRACQETQSSPANLGGDVSPRRACQETQSSPANLGGDVSPRRAQAENSSKTSRSLSSLLSPLSSLNSQGTVHLVGFGPGDPDLLTLKAVKAIERADIILYDDLIDQKYLDSIEAEKVYVGKRAGYHHAEQADINRLMLEAARKGKDVVRLKGGDPMLFAHGSEEIEYLESNLVRVEVIPGITTASALAASLKVSLTHRDLSSSVALVSGHTPEPLTPTAETLVYYMGANRLQAIASRLVDEGWALNTPVVLTYHVSHRDEETFERTLGQLRTESEHFPTPLIVLVGHVASLRHSQAASIRPTLYTGIMPPVDQRHPDYTYTPLIEIQPEHNPQAYLDFLQASTPYHYLLFTSRHAVKSWMAQAAKYGAPTWPTIVSIGPTTTAALREAGIEDVQEVDRDNSYGVLEWFERALQTAPQARRVFIPRSNLALPIIPDGLRQQGYEVTTATAYYTTMPRSPRRVQLSHYRRVVFTSPSTIDAFVSLYGSLPMDMEYQCRGPITQQYLQNRLKGRKRT